MSVQNRLISLKQLISLGAIAGTSIFLGFPALAQSSINSDASANTILAQAESTGDDFELSPEGFEILCERFPLNSRCDGTAGSGSDGISGTVQDPNTDVSDPPIQPGNSPSDDSSGGTQETSPGDDSDGLGTPSDGSMEGTPGSPSDPNTDTTTPPFGSGNSPADGSEGAVQERPGETMSPDGTMQSPDGMMQSPGGAPLDNRPPAAEPDGSTVPPTENR